MSSASTMPPPCRPATPWRVHGRRVLTVLAIATMLAIVPRGVAAAWSDRVAPSEVSRGPISVVVTSELGAGEDEGARQAVLDTTTAALAHQGVTVVDAAPRVLVVRVGWAATGSTTYDVQLAWSADADTPPRRVDRFACACDGTKLLAALTAHLDATVPPLLAASARGEPSPGALEVEGAGSSGPTSSAVEPGVAGSSESAGGGSGADDLDGVELAEATPAPPSVARRRDRAKLAMLIGGAGMIGATVGIAAYAATDLDRYARPWYGVLGAGAVTVIVGGAVLGASHGRERRRRATAWFVPGPTGLSVGVNGHF